MRTASEIQGRRHGRRPRRARPRRVRAFGREEAGRRPAAGSGERRLPPRPGLLRRARAADRRRGRAREGPGRRRQDGDGRPQRPRGRARPEGRDRRLRRQVPGARRARGRGGCEGERGRRGGRRGLRERGPLGGARARAGEAVPGHVGQRAVDRLGEDQERLPDQRHAVPVGAGDRALARVLARAEAVRGDGRRPRVALSRRPGPRALLARAQAGLAAGGEGDRRHRGQVRADRRPGHASTGPARPPTAASCWPR